MATNEIVVTQEDKDVAAALEEKCVMVDYDYLGFDEEQAAAMVAICRTAAEQRGYERAREQAADIALDVATCGGAGERDFERIIGDDIATAIRSMKGEGR